MVAGPMKKLDASDYGPATTITFGPAPAQPPKKLTQATLGDVMKKYRAGREVGEQEAPPPHPFGHAPVVSSNPVNWGEKEEGNNGGGSNVSDGGGADPLGKAATAAAHSPFRWDSSAAKPPCTAPKMTKVSHIIEPSVSNVTATSTHSMHSSMASHWSIPRPRQHQSTSLLSGPLPPSQPPSTSAFKLQARATLLGADCAPDAAAESASAQRWSWLQNRVDAAGRSPDDAAFDPRTLHIPQQEFAKLRGFNRQYWSIKKDAMDLVLFVRVGSFYELYDTDADVGLRVGLNPMGTGPEANMWKVGCNAGSFQHWAAKVLALGYCVGRVEECSGRRDPDPACAKLVARRLAQIYTPGTVTTPLAGEWEGEGGPQPYVALFEGANSLMGACVVDVPSATLGLAQWHEVDATRSTLGMLLSQINPAEVVVLGRRELSLDTRKALKRHRPLVTDGVERPLVVSYLRRYTLTHDPECPDHLPGLMRATEAAYFALNGNDAAFRDAAASLCDMPLAAAALQMALAHLKATDTARYVLPNVTLTAMASFTLDGVRNTGHMMLDAAALHSLELVEGSLGGVKGSLLAFLSSAAATAAGRRRIRTWLCSPLYRVGDINERLDTVSAFMKAPEAAGRFQGLLRGAPDCERLLPRAAALLNEVVDAAASRLDESQDAEEEPSKNNEAYVDEGAAEEAAGAVVTWARFAPVMRFVEGLTT